MRRFQSNTQQLDAELLLPLLRKAAKNARKRNAPEALSALLDDDRVREALKRLRRWDFSTPTGIEEGYDAADWKGRRGRVRRSEARRSVAATIYNVWRGQLVRSVLDARLAELGVPGVGSPRRAQGHPQPAHRGALHGHRRFGRRLHPGTRRAHRRAATRRGPARRAARRPRPARLGRLRGCLRRLDEGRGEAARTSPPPGPATRSAREAPARWRARPTRASRVARAARERPRRACPNHLWHGPAPTRGRGGWPPGSPVCACRAPRAPACGFASPGSGRCGRSPRRVGRRGRLGRVRPRRCRAPTGPAARRVWCSGDARRAADGGSTPAPHKPGRTTWLTRRERTESDCARVGRAPRRPSALLVRPRRSLGGNPVGCSTGGSRHLACVRWTHASTGAAG